VGASKGPYNPEFPKGTKVKILSRGALEAFARTWTRFHEDQLNFHDVEAVVEVVGSYHGGDLLYKLSHVLGIWHGQCLKEISTKL
jgi:hypothetical protein